jgi:tetraacyldisaccharide 4'-kinase
VYRRGVLAGVRTTIARWLEEGALSSPASRMVGRAHAALAGRSLARPLRVPSGLVTITVGGSTLGGSGKTRVALACAREVASHGAEVVLVGHAYRASPRGARVVGPRDALDEVGDEALACVRELETTSTQRVRVVVAASRQAAVDLAVRLVPRVDVVVLDGPLQLSPSRSSLSILALDARAPWGAGAAPPAGDLRAPREVLLAHADEVVHVDATPRAVWLGSPARALDLPAFASSFAGARLGLFAALARPARLLDALAAAGLAPHEVVRAADHGPLSASLARRLSASDSRVDLWLATSKCAVHLDPARLGERLAILDGALVLPPRVTARLRSLVDAAAARVRLTPTCAP